MYASMLTIANLDKSTVDIPEIRNGNGVLINPAEYKHKLESGMVVMVVAYLKV